MFFNKYHPACPTDLLGAIEWSQSKPHSSPIADHIINSMIKLEKECRPFRVKEIVIRRDVHDKMKDELNACLRIMPPREGDVEDLYGVPVFIVDDLKRAYEIVGVKLVDSLSDGDS